MFLMAKDIGNFICTPSLRLASFSFVSSQQSKNFMSVSLLPSRLLRNHEYKTEQREKRLQFSVNKFVLRIQIFANNNIDCKKVGRRTREGEREEGTRDRRCRRGSGDEMNDSSIQITWGACKLERM